MEMTTTLSSGLPLDAADAARLALETIEALGTRAEGLSKASLMELLRRVMRSGIHTIEAAEDTVSFEEAAWASVQARASRRPTTKRDLRHFVRRMLRVEGVARRPLRAMTTCECRELLHRAFGASLHSYRKGRAILHSVFAFGMRHEWNAKNPVDLIESPRIIEKVVRPLTLEEVRRLEESAKSPICQAMRLSLHLMLYCGIRPAEVQRLRIEDIQWKEKRVIIRPRTSKTGGGRIVPLRKVATLRNFPCCIPNGWQRRWKELRRAAGFTQWQADALRHTFASYHAAHFKDLPALQLEMGHRSTWLLQCRYVGIVEEDAGKFWEMTNGD